MDVREIVLMWEGASLDEILDLHGCKCDANNMPNIKHFIYYGMQMSITFTITFATTSNV